MLSILYSINLYSIYILKKKEKYIKFKSNFTNNTLYKKSNIKIQKIKSELKSLKYPYGLNLKNYIILKYVLSIFSALLILYRSSNIIYASIYFTIIYFFPNILIYLFKKKEAIIIIDELFKISDNLLLTLSSNMTLYKSLKICMSNIKYKRLKEQMDIFILDYEMYNFNIEKSVDNIRDKFNCLEFNMFLDILIQGEKEGKLIQNLEMFSENLELSYFKTLKYKASKRMMYVVLSCLIAVVNIALITVYPLINEIMQNMSSIFM